MIVVELDLDVPEDISLASHDGSGCEDRIRRI